MQQQLADPGTHRGPAHGVPDPDDASAGIHPPDQRLLAHADILVQRGKAAAEGLQTGDTGPRTVRFDRGQSGRPALVDG
jgi:hypothetical protein